MNEQYIAHNVMANGWKIRNIFVVDVRYYNILNVFYVFTNVNYAFVDKRNFENKLNNLKNPHSLQTILYSFIYNDLNDVFYNSLEGKQNVCIGIQPQTCKNDSRYNTTFNKLLKHMDLLIAIDGAYICIGTKKYPIYTFLSGSTTSTHNCK